MLFGLRFRLSLAILGLLVLARHSALAQGEFNNWYFGARAGLTFNATAPPSALTDGDLYTAEGCATVSDSAGNLLFYSNGLTVWNRLHRPVPHGTDLLGDISSVNGALAVKQPGTHHRYYIFTPDLAGGFNGLRYSVLAMRADSGRGAIDSLRKNVQLRLRTTEKLAWVPHPLGSFGWLIGQANDTALYFAYRLDARGLDTTAVISAIGALNRNSDGVSQLKVSPDGTRLANVHHESPLVELFDFDVSTGRLSNPLNLTIPNASFGLYGLEFSASGRRLYVGQFSPNNLYQFDLGAGGAAAINASRQRVGTTASLSLAGLQRGPDGRIYVACFDSLLSVVQAPDSAGLACRFVERAVSLRGRWSGYGLPTPVGLAPHPFQLTSGDACAGGTAAFGFGPTPAGVSGRWNFGDPASGPANVATGAAPIHIYSAPGTYPVTLTLDVLGSPLVLRTTVTVFAPPALTLPDTVRQCPGEPVTLAATTAEPGRFRWSTGDTTATVSVATPGAYWAELTSPQGCRTRATVRVVAVAPPAPLLGADTTVCFDDGLLTLRTRQPLDTYRWSTGDTTATVRVGAPGTYRVAGRLRGCEVRDSVVVRAQCPLLIPNVITPNADGANDTFGCQGFESSDVDLQIFSRWGARVFAEANYRGTWAAVGLPAGTYFYHLREAATGRSYKGFVEVVR